MISFESLAGPLERLATREGRPKRKHPGSGFAETWLRATEDGKTRSPEERDFRRRCAAASGLIPC